MPITVEFAFVNNCNLLQTYQPTFYLGGIQVADPPFYTFDEANNHMIIETVDTAYSGLFYTIEIYSELNLFDPNSITTSTDSATFNLVFAHSQCVLTQFNDESIPTIEYFLDEGGALYEYQFNDFTDTLTESGSVNCGARQYEFVNLDTSLTGIVNLQDPRKIQVQTSDINLLGTYQVELLVSLQDFQDLKDVVFFSKIVTVKIDDRCLATEFFL